jgi:hypothetical protein
LNSSIEASSTVPTGSSSWPINVRRYVMFIMLAAMKLGCYQRCSLQKDYRLGVFGEVMDHVFMTSGFEAPLRVTGLGTQKLTVTRVNCHSSNARRSIFDVQAHLILVMLTTVIMVPAVLLKQIFIVTTKHDRRHGPVTVCHSIPSMYSCLHFRILIPIQRWYYGNRRESTLNG